MKRTIFNSVIAVFALGLFSTCSTNPVTGKKQVVLMSEAQEIAMGQEADPQIIQEFGLYPDSALQRYMNQKGQEMARISHRPNIEYHFRVLNSDVINAFAVPGGYVYFTRGIMAHLNNEAQFSGVLGHEIGHVAARHTVSQQTKQTFMQIGLIGGMILSPQIAKFGESLSQGLGLLMLKYGRDAEKQSDDLGVQYSSKIGYDAHQMASFFTTLERQSEKSGQRLPEFLSTHPDPGNRYNTVNQLATQWQQANGKTAANMKVGRDTYLRLIEGIVYGEDPREGFRENGVFYHPEMKFQFNTPQGWQYQNSPTQVAFAPQDGSAVLILTAGQGNTLNAAAQALIQKANLQVSQSQQTTINGFPAMVIVADQIQQNQQTGQNQVAARAMIHFIQDGNSIYEFIGATSPQNFNNYAGTFQSVPQSFKKLTDPAKINIKPERVRLKTLNQSMTLQQALTNYGMPSSRHEDLAILNGMQLTDKLASGTIIKIVQRN